MKLKDKAHNQYKRTKNTNRMNSYQSLRNQVTTAISNEIPPVQTINLTKILVKNCGKNLNVEIIIIIPEKHYQIH